MGALRHGLGRKVVDDEDVGLGAGLGEGTGGVVLAVVAGEDRDGHAWARDLGAGEHRGRDVVLGGEPGLGLDLGERGICRGAVGEDALDGALPGLLQLGEVCTLALGHELIGLGGGADDLDVHIVGVGGQLGAIGELHE